MKIYIDNNIPIEDLILALVERIKDGDTFVRIYAYQDLVEPEGEEGFYTPTPCAHLELS